MSLETARELNHTLALVLAGGRGSRLKQLTDKQSKPAVPFGGKFRIIDFPLSNCINSGIRKIAVLTQYRAHTLIHHLQRGWSFLRPEIGEFVEIWPAQQQTESESWYQGTADAVYQNLEIITHHKPKYVLILAGDHIYKQNYSQLIDEHIRKGADVTVSCMEVPRKEASAFGVVDANAEGQIVDFVEKPENPPAVPGKPDSSFVSMGIYVFSYDVLMESLQGDAIDKQSSHDFGNDLLPHLVNSKCKVMAHEFHNSCIQAQNQDAASESSYWRDVGTIDAYWEANLDLVSVTPQLDLYDMEWPVWTNQRQLPAAKFVFDKDNRRGMAVDTLVSAGCVISGSMVRRCLLFSNSRVNSYGEIEETLILPRADIGRNCKISRAIIDADCKIPEGMVIGEDPEEDARRFHRSEGGITLVTASMLEKLK